MTRPSDISEQVWDEAFAAYVHRCNTTSKLAAFFEEDEVLELIARAILAERERINALIEKKAQPFSDSRNPLASELVAALDDLRVCVTRGEVA